jgi:hypothetical protein
MQKLKITEVLSKIKKKRWAGGMTQVVENLLCKYEALSSNPGTPPPLPKKIYFIHVSLTPP